MCRFWSNGNPTRMYVAKSQNVQISKSPQPGQNSNWWVHVPLYEPSIFPVIWCSGEDSSVSAPLSPPLWLWKRIPRLELACSEISILHTPSLFPKCSEVANYLKAGIHPHWLSCQRAVDEGCCRGTSFIKATPPLLTAPSLSWTHSEGSSISLSTAVATCGLYTCAFSYLLPLLVSPELWA